MAADEYSQDELARILTYSEMTTAEPKGRMLGTLPAGPCDIQIYESHNQYFSYAVRK